MPIPALLYHRSAIRLAPICEGKFFILNRPIVSYQLSLQRHPLTFNSWGTGTECNNDCTGTVAAQQYINTVITLKEADTTFGNTIAKASGATYSGLASSSGGKVWTIKQIDVPAMS
jgi:hypothetical protein